MKSKTEAIETWRTLNQALQTADEQACMRMLNREKHGKRRAQFLLRIFGKYNRLRTERERRELLQ